MAAGALVGFLGVDGKALTAFSLVAGVVAYSVILKTGWWRGAVLSLVFVVASEMILSAPLAA